MHRTRALIGTAMIAGALMALPAPAMAKSGDIVRTGNCSGAADWKVKAGARDGGIEVEFEVDSNRVGQTWRVKIRDNGVLRYNNLRTTKAPSGSFTVHRTIRNMSGTDNIVARARNIKSGQVCIAKVNI